MTMLLVFLLCFIFVGGNDLLDDLLFVIYLPEHNLNCGAFLMSPDTVVTSCRCILFLSSEGRLDDLRILASYRPKCKFDSRVKWAKKHDGCVETGFYDLILHDFAILKTAHDFKGVNTMPMSSGIRIRNKTSCITFVKSVSTFDMVAADVQVQPTMSHCLNGMCPQGECPKFVKSGKNFMCGLTTGCLHYWHAAGSPVVCQGEVWGIVNICMNNYLIFSVLDTEFFAQADAFRIQLPNFFTFLPIFVYQINYFL